MAVLVGGGGDIIVNNNIAYFLENCMAFISFWSFPHHYSHPLCLM